MAQSILEFAESSSTGVRRRIAGNAFRLVPIGQYRGARLEQLECSVWVNVRILDAGTKGRILAKYKSWQDFVSRQLQSKINARAKHRSSTYASPWGFHFLQEILKPAKPQLKWERFRPSESRQDPTRAVRVRYQADAARPQPKIHQHPLELKELDRAIDPSQGHREAYLANNHYGNHQNKEIKLQTELEKIFKYESSEELPWRVQDLRQQSDKYLSLGKDRCS